MKFQINKAIVITHIDLNVILTFIRELITEIFIIPHSFWYTCRFRFQKFLDNRAGSVSSLTLSLIFSSIIFLKSVLSWRKFLWSSSVPNVALYFSFSCRISSQSESNHCGWNWYLIDFLGIYAFTKIANNSLKKFPRVIWFLHSDKAIAVNFI